MPRGDRWTDSERELLMKMRAQGLTPQQIFDSGGLPERTMRAIEKELERCGTGQRRRATTVQAIHPAANSLSMERIVKLFSSAVEQICELEEVDKVVLERFRIIFQAAKDYGPLLAGYEKWEKIEKRIEELSAAVAELQAAKGVKQASENRADNQRAAA